MRFLPSNFDKAIPIKLSGEALIVSVAKILGQKPFELLLAHNFQAFFVLVESYGGLVAVILSVSAYTSSISSNFLIKGGIFLWVAGSFPIFILKNNIRQQIKFSYFHISILFLDFSFA